MLQLQNVTKTYTTKAGTVKALDGVSLTFPTTGLVFITGKSGCGKTTLLNVIGGLDGINEGEILIQDKKFSTFSATEYDSYRNTFIGFIFQEYNLLPEFTVEKNIKIAMELQGQKADDAEFEKLIKDVEIEEFKDRTPAELSGGQRQRVAIARALVKRPRIIMADEPTGALDSTTGEQVLNTLKKLSKNTLIIVVSHDREFAEKYADRIIHLVDGKVEQDVSFAEKVIDSNVSERGNMLVVREGAELSENEKDTLAKAIKERKKIEVIENPSFRDKQATGAVAHSVENPVSLCKSQMKLKSAVSLGVKSLTVKPVRLVITILISAIAFAVFALFDTIANFSTANILKNQLRISSSKTIVTTSNYVVDYGAGDSYGVKLSQNAVNSFQSKTGGAVKGIFDLRGNVTGGLSQSLSIAEIYSSDVVVGKKYYANSVSGLIEFDAEKEILANGNFKEFGYKLTHGTYPQHVYEDATKRNSAYNVAISSYLADSIIYYLNGKPLDDKTIDTYNDLLGCYITVNQEKYVIVGIINCGSIPKKYDVLREPTPYNIKYNALLEDYNAYINAGAHKCLFVANDFLQTVKEKTRAADIFYTGNVNWTISAGNSLAKKQVATYLYNAEAYTTGNVLLFDGENSQSGKISLADDEILIHHKNLENLFSASIAALSDSKDRAHARDLINGMDMGDYESNRLALTELFELLKVNISNVGVDATVYQRFTQTDKKYDKAVKIVGVYFGVDPDRYTSSATYKLMMNKNLMQEFEVFPEQGDYSKLLFSEQSVRKGRNVIVNSMISESGLMLSWYNNSVLNVIRENETMIRQAADLFLYVAVILAVFSIFMLFNYMSTSIANKKRSVGVLRALGAGGKDILLTFLSESLVVSLINGILANVFAVIGCELVNTYILEIMNISVRFALFGVRQVVIICAISLLTALVASALPIFNITKKKPVELIRRA